LATKLSILMQRSVCIVVCKAPQLGRVKTRLAAEIGDERALTVYRELLRITLKAVASPAWDVVIVLDGDASCMPPHPYRCIPQRGNDLGERIVHAMHDVGGCDRYVVVGSDTPTMTTRHIADAFHALDTHDVVLGPANDGGYWLIGMQQLHPDLFADIPWSTDRVLTRTRERCEEHARTYALLDVLSDVDVKDDIESLSPNPELQLIVDAVRMSDV
jgi:rSAM/selenodomain-associated transferase 1